MLIIHSVDEVLEENSFSQVLVEDLKIFVEGCEVKEILRFFQKVNFSHHTTDLLSLMTEVALVVYHHHSQKL